MPWYWSLKVATPGLELTAPGAPAGRGRGIRLVGGAIVEVWGDAGQVEALRQLRTRLKPSLVRAFRLGEASDTGVQTLSEIMAMGSGFHVPGSPSVFYNVYRPALPDAELLRFEGQLWGKGKASLSVSTRP